MLEAYKDIVPDISFIGILSVKGEKVKLDPSFREVNFNVLSVQSVPKNMCDFIF